VTTDSFVLHSPEWQVTFASGQKWFLTNPQDLTIEQAKSNITVNKSTIAKIGDKIHTVPNSFDWTSILHKKITGIEFYKRVLKNKKFLGLDLAKTYQDNIQIIQFFCAGKTFSITTMNGDIGQMTFYPTGYLGDRLGFFFGKTIADSHTVHGVTMIMEMTAKVSGENN
jgi:hypothetical protein